MPANAAVADVNWTDSVAALMKPFFQNESGELFSGYRWQVTNLKMKTGAEMSTATCRIPLKGNALDEVAPTIACMPLSLAFKIGQRMCVKGYINPNGDESETILFVGNITKIVHDVAQDELVIECVCDKWLLEAIQIIGSWWINPTDGTGRYRQGWAAHFNPRGYPNCTFCSIEIQSPSGNGTTSVYLPVFCAPNWGLAEGETVPGIDSTAVQSGLKATYWTLDLILIYLFGVISQGLMNNATYGSSSFKWLPTFPADKILWTASYASVISSSDLQAGSTAKQANSARTNQQRKGREMVLEGMTVLAALTEVLKSAGPYELFMAPLDQKKSMLSVVRTRYGGQGITIERPASGTAADAFGKSPTVVTEGQYIEDGRSAYTRAVGAGNLVFIETRVASNTTNTGTLKTAWPASLKTDAETEIKALLNAGTYAKSAAGALQALEERILTQPKYSKLLAAWRVSETFDFQSGTSESSKPRCEFGRPILQHLLSSFLEDYAANPNTYQRLNARAPVQVEFSSTGVSNWIVQNLGDGLHVDSDGTIWLTGLRTARRTLGGNITVSPTSGTVTTVTIPVMAVRMTVAIPCDHRLIASIKLASDATSGVSVLPDSENDVDRFEKGLSRLYYADSQDLHTKEIRSSAYPVPESAGGTIKTNDPLRDDSTYLQAQVIRRLLEVGRIQRSGRLIMPHIHMAITVGTAIEKLNNSGLQDSTFPIRGVVVGLEYSSDEDSQSLALEVA